MSMLRIGKHRARTGGFTLIELLTVIAIIAILSAVLLPVFARAKDNAYRSSDIQRMNEIRTALQLYKADNDAYPPALLGYATLYMTGPQTGQVVPATQYNGHLYSRRIPSLDTLRPSYNRVDANLVTKAVWPNQDPRPVGSAPILDLDGDGDIDNNDDFAGARQAFGPLDTVLAESPIAVSPCDGGSASLDACFYQISGYDVALIPETGSGPARFEVHYARFWTSWGLSTGHANDDPRQLGYQDPPDNTVITWNTYFREYSGGQPVIGRRDIVLFLGGAARPFDSRALYERSWRVLP
ncbi:MAG: hypothetical protein UZ18_ATM001001685 [Armatimonadetes bacterium OLB18]|nr:MAG: hypothetical protein UZ18_ATM001001685 [Armatimonadetes bacterium OLB18]